METLHVIISKVSVCIILIYHHKVFGPMVISFYLLIRHKTCGMVVRDMVLCLCHFIESFARQMSYYFQPFIGRADELQSGLSHKTVL